MLFLALRVAIELFFFVFVAVSAWHYYCLIVFIAGYGQNFSYLQRYQHLGRDYSEIILPAKSRYQVANYNYSKKNKIFTYFFGSVAFLPFLAFLNASQFTFFVAKLTVLQQCILFLLPITQLRVILFLFVVALESKIKNILPHKPLVYLFLFCLLIFHGRSEVYNFRTYINRTISLSFSSKSFAGYPKKMSSVLKILLPHFSRQAVYLYPKRRPRNNVSCSRDLSPWPLAKKEFENYCKNKHKWQKRK